MYTPIHSIKGKVVKNIPESHLRQRAWVEINKDAIKANTSVLHSLLAPGCQLMAVVKADGYGHGALTAAEAAEAGGASSCGVATLYEGIQLREGGIQSPILVLGNITQPEELRACHDWQIMPTVSTIREALLCQRLAEGSGRAMQIHVKFDTGMTRLGINWEAGLRMITILKELNFVKVIGVYTHLALTDESNIAKTFTQIQKQRFLEVVKNLQKHKIRFGYRHLANSAGTLMDNGIHFDMVRIGLGIYGQMPHSFKGKARLLQPALQVRARVTLIRQVPIGVGVSYGHNYITSRASRIAVISIGYADGVPRLLSGRMEVLFKGKRLPQIGSITMDQLIIDATEARELKVGSIVTLLGTSGSEHINAFDWSERCRTIPWEILCGFKHRLPRLVVNSNN